MSNKTLSYKGYLGTIDFDLDKKLLRGKVLHIKSLITYSGATIEELEASFQEELEAYLNDCAELGVEPNKPFSGVFQIRVSPNTHRKLAQLASETSEAVNHHVCIALDQYLDNRKIRNASTRELAQVISKLSSLSLSNRYLNYSVIPTAHPIIHLESSERTEFATAFLSADTLQANDDNFVNAEEMIYPGKENCHA